MTGESGSGATIQRILLATDGSDCAGKAVQTVAGMGFPSGTLVQAICVLDPYIESLLDSVRKEERGFADRLKDEACTRLSEAGLLPDFAVLHGDAAHQIIQASEAFGADLIVVGSHGRTGLSAVLLGSVARNVAQHAQRSVLVVRDLPTSGGVVLGIDESAHSARATDMVAALPECGPVIVVNVVRPANVLLGMIAVQDDTLYQKLTEEEQRRRAAGELLAAQRALHLTALGKECRTLVRVGDPAAELLKVAETEQAGLIAVGARGTSLIQGLLVGSVADHLLKGAHCSLLLAR